MSQTAVAKEKQAKVSFFAGALFFLAGAINLFAGMHQARGEHYGLGAMLIAVGALWMAIGARNRREARALAVVEGSQGGQV